MLGKLSSAAGLAAILLVATGAAASAATTDSASGVEIHATSTDGQFVGAIQGIPLAGSFYANVEHDPLTTTTTAITGGTVTVYLRSGRTAAGSFADSPTGIENLTDPTGACSAPLFSTTTQSYAVSDQVNLGSILGEYQFKVTLTHYLISLPSFLGGCTTYFATIGGFLSSS